MRRIIGLFGFVALSCWLIWLGGSFSIFFDLPSVILTVGVTFFLSITKHSLQEILELSDDVLNSLVNNSFVAGGIGALVGAIQALTTLNVQSELGARLAIGLLPFFYSLILATIFHAMKAGISRKTVRELAAFSTLASIFCILFFMHAFRLIDLSKN